MSTTTDYTEIDDCKLAVMISALERRIFLEDDGSSGLRLRLYAQLEAHRAELGRRSRAAS